MVSCMRLGRGWTGFENEAVLNERIPAETGAEPVKPPVLVHAFTTYDVQPRDVGFP